METERPMRMQAIRSAKHAQMTPTSRRGLSFIVLAGWARRTARPHTANSPRTSASRIITQWNGSKALLPWATAVCPVCLPSRGLHRLSFLAENRRYTDLVGLRTLSDGRLHLRREA
eukprot:scaffold77090_cov67-Phaeocystis_antarctica.AAC.3